MRYIWFVVLAVLVILVNAESWDVCELISVKDRANCTCEINGDDTRELFFYCNGVDISISADNYVKMVIITCKGTLNSTLVLPKLGIMHSGHELRLFHCLSSGVPLSDILDRLEVGATTNVSVEGKMDSLASGQLANLTDVIRIELNGLGLTHIDHNVFGDVNSPDSSIQKLYIRHNNISQLDHRVFKKLTHLEVLDLSFNQLTSLPDDLFLHNKALMDLSIGNNRLESFSSQLLINQRSLVELTLYHNLLKHLSGEWTGLDSLVILDLSYNQLTSLGEGEESVLRHLHKLDNLWLHNNNLTRLYRDWARLKSIASIYLSNNNIQTFKVEDFAEVTHDMTIDLHNNQITKVTIVSCPNEIVNDTTKAVITVKLSSNPLICDCHLHSFVRYTRGDQALALHKVRFEFKHPVCGNPPTLKNRLIKDLSLEELACSPSM